MILVNQLVRDCVHGGNIGRDDAACVGEGQAPGAGVCGAPGIVGHGQQIGNISRSTAIRLLKSILSGKGNVEKIKKINDIPVNPLFDSELEQRFMEAVRTKVGAANVNDSIRNGKHSYYIKLGDFSWEIEPQVVLDAEQGVIVKCKPDFVFWPVSAPDHLPIAVFTDGFTYHKDIVADDTLKREAIRRSGNFRVWSLSFKDVQNVFATQGDYATDTLEATKMPSGTRMYLSTVKKEQAEDLNPSKLSAFDQLIFYLQNPDAERLFRIHAYAYGLSLLEPGLMKNNLAFSSWDETVEKVKDQTHYTETAYTFPGTAFGTWVPRQNNAHLAIYAGILPDQMKNGGQPAVCAVLKDEKENRSDRYEHEWNGFFHFSNVMQFAEDYIGVSSSGLEQVTCLNLPAFAQAPVVSADAASDEGWAAILELLFDDDAKAFAETARDEGIPAASEDNIGYEVEGSDGEVIATVEIAWPDLKIGFLTEEQLEDKEKLESEGWKIIDLLNLNDMKSAFGGEN